MYNDKEKKLFCSGNSGNNQGWSDAGLNLFNSLYHQIREGRKTNVELEELVR